MDWLYIWSYYQCANLCDEDNKAVQKQKTAKRHEAQDLMRMFLLNKQEHSLFRFYEGRKPA